jgi:3-oxoacyl-[acyl-carrier protein] reductase
MNMQLKRQDLSARPLAGKVSVVTGSTSGIGLGIARALAQAGSAVVLNGFGDPSEIARAKAGIATETGVKVSYSPADMTKPDQIAEMIASTLAEYGRLDILVNNAGIWQQNILTEATDEEFDRIVDVNVRAVFLAARAASRVMQPGGRIINIGSVLGERVPFPGVGLYSMSKFAVAGLTRAWARDLGPRGITVNCIQPGPIDTDMNPATGDFAAVQRQGTALDRYGRADEIAATASFLASPEATYVTGATINVDGGTIA